ncbi:hypothetical protein SPV1_11466 [Mariprofundus ferrooxydans PV-1]|uniref:Uncharacterized protein n=2 Tax=Mariprofundus ferrooxydans TaxID=314344 RepID=Q0F143_9PROT|nr:hypothetical protein SPV1_11466 [Mariprofundus ferrooxydans PV-1]
MLLIVYHIVRKLFPVEVLKMKREMYMGMMLAMTLGVMGGSTAAYASDDKPKVYGRELMSGQERSEQRQKMRNMNETEREQYRAEQHERMRERAKEQGKQIPAEVGERKKGMGQGAGRGSGMGQGAGRGSGMGQGAGRGSGMGQGAGRGSGMGQGAGGGQRGR